MTTDIAAAFTGAQSVLVVVPAPATAEPLPGDTEVLGVSLRRRIAMAAERAGFGLAVTAAELNGAAPSQSRIVLLPANVLPQAGWLRELREMPLDPDTIYLDPSGTAVVETAAVAHVFKVAGRAAPADVLVAELAGTFAVRQRAPHPNERFAIRTRAEVRAAETWLLRGLIKANEGFMSRHVERRISLALTRFLVRTRVTPNMITVVSVGIGLAGAPFFLSVHPVAQVAGALLFLTHSILDGCDGEIARLKFLESRGGAVLDFWGDNLVHQAIFACMAIGWSLASQAAWPLLLGALAVAGTLGVAAIASRRFINGEALVGADRVDGEARAGADRTLGRLVDAVSHRDFIYLIVALAIFGRAQWFIALAAAGTPPFLLLLAWVSGKRRTR
jgi:phosphatidylglycerophosphate synthase